MELRLPLELFIVWVGWWGWGKSSRKFATICMINTSKQPVPTTQARMKGWVVRQEMVGNFDEAEVKMKSTMLEPHQARGL